MRKLPILVAGALASLSPLISIPADAQEFAAAVSPPRFELTAKPGERLRQVIEISNASKQASTYRIYTADWAMTADAGVNFQEELQAGSCRPWVALERHEITVPGGGRYRFRFEVEAPADTPASECRFAVMIEGAEQMTNTKSGLNFPVSGRIGVIVYATVGGAQASLKIADAVVAEVNGQKLPVLHVNNLGNAHGRLEGFLSGTDAGGKKLDFSPATLPILPQETRAIALAAMDRSGSPVQITYPVRISGVLEWGTADRLEINQLFGQ